MQVYAATIHQSFELADLQALVSAQYAQGATPVEAARAGLQIGLGMDVILQLPEVTGQALIDGWWQMKTGDAYAPATDGGMVYASTVHESFALADLDAAVLSGYECGKTPALAAKSALQLGLSLDVILQLPQVTPQDLAQGWWYIATGAFPLTTTNTIADSAYSGPVDLNSEQCQARLADGLDPYGFPPQQVELMKATGTYIDPYAGIA